MNRMLVHFLYKHITGEEDNLSSSPVICLYQKFRTLPDFYGIHKVLMFTPVAIIVSFEIANLSSLSSYSYAR